MGKFVWRNTLSSPDSQHSQGLETSRTLTEHWTDPLTDSGDYLIENLLPHS